MAGRTQYQDEYCHMKGGGKETKGGSSGSNASGLIPCSKPEEVQPVGGRMQAKAFAEAEARQAEKQRLPAYDESFVATVYSSGDRGTHRKQNQWHDSRWFDPTRIEAATLYEPADRDPPNRNNFYVYRTTLIDAMDTPCKPLTVPDVHKLRYMQNQYMTCDDWY